MSMYFQKVSRFADIDLPMPQRGTSDSAGYDFVVAEDIVLPPYDYFVTKMKDNGYDAGRETDFWCLGKPYTLDEIAQLTKELKCKVPLVSTGMKCHLDEGQYLELSVRSSTPLKHWLVLANGIGIIDRDYYNNSANEGEIFFQLINFSPFAIELKRGDKIGQGIIKSYGKVEDDNATNERIGGFGSTT